MRFGIFTFTKTRNIDPGKRLSIARDRIIRECDFVLDIGANSGQWISAVREKNPSIKGLCIEPLPTNFQKLSSIGLKNTEYLNIAVGNTNGEIFINVASNGGLSSSILQIGDAHKNAAPNVKFVRRLKIKILKLSKILDDYKYRKIFIKIDSQGYELEILKSIKPATWKQIHAFEIEVNLIATYENCGLIEEVISLLRRKGFYPYRVEQGFGMPNFGQQLQMDILFKK